MKILFTIFFFAGTLLFVFLTYLFMKEIDNGSEAQILVLIFSSIVASIFLLAFLLRKYIK
jgi:Na+-driven multidrug efflux pump